MSALEANSEKEEKPDSSGHRVKLVIAVVVLTLAIGYLVLSTVQSSSAYYMTVGELKAGLTALKDKKVRIVGTLVGDSVEWDARQLQLDFDIIDDSGQLPVSYKGARPDMLQDGAETIVEGRYIDGTLQATNLLLKCPSKYEEAEPTPATRSAQ